MKKAHLIPKEAATHTEYHSFYQTTMASIPQAIIEALRAPLPWSSLPDVKDLTQLEQAGNAPVENGFSIAKDGSIAIAMKTAATSSGIPKPMSAPVGQMARPMWATSAEPP